VVLGGDQGKKERKSGAMDLALKALVDLKGWDKQGVR
jgi:hypothetical protein